MLNHMQLLVSLGFCQLNINHHLSLHDNTTNNNKKKNQYLLLSPKPFMALSRFIKTGPMQFLGCVWFLVLFLIEFLQTNKTCLILVEFYCWIL